MKSFTDFTNEEKIGVDNRAKKIEYSAIEDGTRQMPFVTWLYLVETRMCYIYEMDVACIVMMMGTFEELFRVIFSSKKSEKSYDSGKDPNSIKFIELLKIAKSRDWITEYEFEKIDELRKIRNKFTHVKKADYKNGKPDLSGITRESMIAETIQPTVDFDGIAEQSIELIPIIYDVLDRTNVYKKLDSKPKI